MKNSLPEMVLELTPGEKITDSVGLWAASDRIVEELGKCVACDHPTFRVVTISAATGLERRVALCGRHYVQAARRYPELSKNGAAASD